MFMCFLKKKIAPQGQFDHKHQSIGMHWYLLNVFKTILLSFQLFYSEKGNVNKIGPVFDFRE